jgi:hypothetical protein
MTTARNRRPEESEAKPRAHAAPAAKSEEKQRGRPFPKGVSGNPRGTRPGSQHKITKRLQSLILPAAPKILAGIIRDAEAGDEEARKIFVKLLPKIPRFAATLIELPKIETAKEAAAQIAELLTRAASGEVDLETLDTVVEALRVFIAAHERTELEAEVEKYREAMKGKRK